MRFKVSTGPVRNTSRTRAILGGLICFSLGGFSTYILFGGGELVSGVPFLSNATNELIGRFVVGLGGISCFVLGGYAFYEVWLLHRVHVKRKMNGV